MRVYIALLRGINVGGKNIIKMSDLKRVFEDMGLCEVSTYIQSGNVLFKSDEKEETLLKIIEHNINEAFGFFVKVVLRTVWDLEQIIQNCPFSEEAISEAEALGEGESLYISLMTREPYQGNIELLNFYNSENEEYKLRGREVFILVRSSIRKSKFTNVIQKLDVPSTVRNWKTINKLYFLARAMHDEGDNA